MSLYNISLGCNKIDYLLSITAMLQPVLTLIQLFMLEAMHMEPETANQFRVMSTAVPIVISLVFVIIRKPSLVFVTYGVVILILMFTVFVFPDRWKYMSDDVMKFTLPVVIPAGLCIASVRNLAVLVRCMLLVSISAALIGFLYAGIYLSGSFAVEGYNMGFSYALLFPTFILISKKGILWKIIALFLMVEMLAIGSRGALLLSVLFWLFTMLWNRKISPRTLLFWATFIILALIFFNPLISFFSDFFDQIGISSRTLRLLTDDELLTHDSGRGDLTENTWKLINMRPLFGSGVWADRQYLGIYCHNVILEILLDFGYIGAILIFGAFLIKQIQIFNKIPANHKSMYIMMFGLILPLFVSSSYLISFNTGMFLGFTYLLSWLNKKKQYQNYQYN